MSELKLYDQIDTAKDKFLAIAGDMDWEKESVFAYQQLTKNSYTLDVARKNPGSVKMAVVNVASIGLSLNPATSYAYLVPRGGEICLDISYQGLIKIATDTGSIKWAKAELVYFGDDFTYRGPTEKPDHNITDPFNSNRGTMKDLKGAYCIAKTHDGDYLVELMSVEELTKIRDEASAAGKKGPWSSYPGEMCKKCVIKRAQKTWPKTDQHERLQMATQHLHDIEGSVWGEDKHRFEPGEKEQIITQMRTALSRGDSFGVLELVQEYDADPQQSEEAEIQSIKFWSLFTSAERNAIHRFLDDNKVAHDRNAMGNPELNEALEI